jgi:uncharacterized protein (DUF983 family)
VSPPRPSKPPSPPEVSPFVAGLMCRCPRCGRGALFTGPLSLAVGERCSVCGLELRFVDTGDGPAVFAIMILGLVILGGALILEFRVHPPWWVHVIVWGPMTLFVALGLLRPLKATLIALQYANKAEEGRLEKD